jgi:hypothetical protein
MRLSSVLCNFDCRPWRADQFPGNTQTYRDDCRKTGVQRNIFQVLMFNRMGNVVLALAGPEVIAKPLGLMLNFFGSLIGSWLLGFSDSYAEYNRPKEA